ncbi:MAG: acyl-CoA dehydrogenase family protein [Acidimicrobiales bacterium]
MTPAAAPAPGLLERARQVADAVLFPAAPEVDRAQLVPASHLDLLAAEGFYGLAAPAEVGGAGVDYPVACEVIRTLASGCLTTAFVWIQHQGVLRRVLGAPPRLRDRLLAPLCRGERRAGVALAGCLPGPPVLVARRVKGGYVLDGSSPWVSGWGMIDTLLVAARSNEDAVLWALVAAHEAETVSVEPRQMVAASASGTVAVGFEGHFVADDAVLGSELLATVALHDAMGLGTNGHLALGVTARCRALLGPSGLDPEAASCQAALLEGDVDSLPAARAAASELAVRAATMLLVHTGSGAILSDGHAQRLAREAMFCCVFGSRPSIKAELLSRLRVA